MGQDMSDAFGYAFSVLKALNPSMQDDPNMGAGMRHRDNLERQKDIHTQQPNLRGPMRMGRRFQPPPVPVPQGHYRHDEGQMSRPQPPMANQNRTLPPNPAQMPIGAGAPSMREAGGGPRPTPAPPQPVSQDNPFLNAIHPDATLSDEHVRTLADEFRIPIEKAWSHLRYR